jgi:hypothetical protein
MEGSNHDTLSALPWNLFARTCADTRVLKRSAGVPVACLIWSPLSHGCVVTHILTHDTRCGQIQATAIFLQGRQLPALIKYKVLGFSETIQ